MFRTVIFRVVIGMLVCSVVMLTAQNVYADKFKVLVVMSYEEEFPWVGEMKKGIDSVLKEKSDITYFYMDTKKDLEGGPKKAEEAYALYQELQPDGVIVADDNAQSMFVVPYLKDKVQTPVMFCGVNSAPEKYGYPAKNVSGILERLHIYHSIYFAKQLDPSIETVGFLMKDSPSGQAVFEQVKSEANTYPAKLTDFKFPKTLNEAIAMTKELRETSDLLYLSSLQGITDDNAQPLTEEQVMPILIETFGKPTFSISEYHLTYGVLCAVVQRGQEQGESAARILQQALEGTPVADIPISTNRKGKTILNLTTLKSLGLKPGSKVLKGVKIVETQN